jgi:hypothetical protein
MKRLSALWLLLGSGRWMTSTIDNLLMFTSGVTDLSTLWINQPSSEQIRVHVAVLTVVLYLLCFYSLTLPGRDLLYDHTGQS